MRHILGLSIIEAFGSASSPNTWATTFNVQMIDDIEIIREKKRVI